MANASVTDEYQMSELQVVAVEPITKFGRPSCSLQRITGKQWLSKDKLLPPRMRNFRKRYRFKREEGAYDAMSDCLEQEATRVSMATTECDTRAQVLATSQEGVKR